MPIKIGVAGVGALGRHVCNRLLEGVPGVVLSATAARNADARPQWLQRANVPNVSVDELPELVDVVVECLSPAAFRDVALPTLQRGRTLVVISSGALLLNLDLLKMHPRWLRQIVLASGALPGLDGVRAACEGQNVSAVLVSRKPAAALVSADFTGVVAFAPERRSRRIFSGNALEAVRAFPRNANIAASVALAGVGAERTSVEIWIDPELAHNTHELTVTSDSGTFRVETRNCPSPENPRSSLLAARSIAAALRTLAAGSFVRMPHGEDR